MHANCLMYYIIYWLFVIILKLYLFHNSFSCNCTEVLIDIRNESSFQMFNVSPVQISTVQQLHYLLKVTLMHAYSYYLSRLLGY